MVQASAMAMDKGRLRSAAEASAWAELQWHWDEAYTFGRAGEGQGMTFWAVRKDDPHEAYFAWTPWDLRVQIREGYRAKTRRILRLLTNPNTTGRTP